MLFLVAAFVPALHVAVASADVETAKRAAAELPDASPCRSASSLLDTCFEDPDCAERAVAGCHADALVVVRVRTEKDGPWVSTRVLDVAGATAFSYDEPRTELGPAVLPPALLATLRSLPEPERAHDDDATTAPTPEPGASWLPGAVAGVGGVVAAAAVSVAAFEELTLRDPAADGATRGDARSGAQIAWVAGGVGAVVAAVGGVWLLMSSGS